MTSYQQGLKERAAAFWGMHWTDFNLPYADWAMIRTIYLAQNGVNANW